MTATDIRNAHARFAARDPWAAWLGSLRVDALARFEAAGFPGRHLEDWKYTSLEPFARRTLQGLSVPVDDDAPARALLARVPPLEAARRVVLLNGRVVPAADKTVAGLNITSLADANAAQRRIIENGLAATAGSSLAALNAAFLPDALLIEVAEGAEITQPLQLLCASGGPLSVQSRVLVRLGAGSRLSLVEQHCSDGPVATNAVTQIDCGPGSQLDYVTLQEVSPDAQHVGAQSLQLAESSHARVVQVELGGSLARTDLQLALHAPGAAAELSGLFIAGDGQHLDTHLRIDHLAPGTRSDAHHRGIAGGHSRGVLDGVIVVHRGADGTDAALETRNLLLGKRAEIDARPELEIYADDVKCSHGATIGQLDDAALFYLRSRGVSRPDARQLLMMGIAAQVTQHIALQALRDRVDAMCRDRLMTVGAQGDSK